MGYSMKTGGESFHHPPPDMARRRRNPSAVQPHTFDLPIGTMLHVTDGFTDKLAQIADVETDRWGSHYVVVSQDGTITKVSYVGPEGAKGIGFFVASAEWIALLT